MSDKAVHDLSRTVEIPCEVALHWRRIALFILVPEDRLRLESLEEQIPVPGERSGTSISWILSDSDDSECHTHLTVDREDDPAEERNWYIHLTTYRAPLHVHEANDPRVSHDVGLNALGDAVTDDEPVFVGVTADIQYPSDTFKWRVSLLAESPTFGEFAEDLGSISLAGLTLDFSQSTVGLRRAALGTSPSGTELRITLSYAKQLTSDQLRNPFNDLLSKAEELSTLFVLEKKS